jgi:hypothetical protein
MIERVDEIAKRKHEWVGITDLEIESIAESCDLWGSDVYAQVIELAATIEKRLKERNYESS